MSLTAVALSTSGDDLGSALVFITLVLSGVFAMPFLLALLEPGAERIARPASHSKSSQTSAVVPPARANASVDRVQVTRTAEGPTPRTPL
jgi:hypothetical protein